MLLHVCDRCRQELDENNTTIFKNYELCESCADRLTEYVTKGAPKEKPVKGVDWHDMKLGMPSRAGCISADHRIRVWGCRCALR